MFAEYILKKKGADVVAVDLAMTAEKVAKVFSENKIGFAVVKDGKGGVIGSVSERDIVKHMSIHGKDTSSAPVKDFMNKGIVTCSPRDSLPKLMSLMTLQRSRHVLVMDGGELMGVVSIGDVVKHRLEESMLDEASLREYISGMGYN